MTNLNRNNNILTTRISKRTYTTSDRFKLEFEYNLYNKVNPDLINIQTTETRSNKSFDYWGTVSENTVWADTFYNSVLTYLSNVEYVQELILFSKYVPISSYNMIKSVKQNFGATKFDLTDLGYKFDLAQFLQFVHNWPISSFYQDLHCLVFNHPGLLLPILVVVSIKMHNLGFYVFNILVELVEGVSKNFINNFYVFFLFLNKVIKKIYIMVWQRVWDRLIQFIIYHLIRYLHMLFLLLEAYLKLRISKLLTFIVVMLLSFHIAFLFSTEVASYLLELIFGDLLLLSSGYDFHIARVLDVFGLIFNYLDYYVEFNNTLRDICDILVLDNFITLFYILNFIRVIKVYFDLLLFSYIAGYNFYVIISHILNLLF